MDNTPLFKVIFVILTENSFSVTYETMDHLDIHNIGNSFVDSLPWITPGF